MNSCHHLGWFYLSGRGGFHLHHRSRASNVIREMTNPDTQHPSMIFFIGKRSKDAALRELFPNNNIRRGNKDGIVNLRLDSSTFSSDLPLLFADGDPSVPIPHRLGATACHQQTTFPLAWSLDQQQSVLQVLYARLVALFSDVICIFADDLGGLDKVADFLVRWVRLGSPSCLPAKVRPRVVIVLREEDAAVTHRVLQIDDLQINLQREHPELRAQVFSSISLMHLAGDHVSSLARHRRLKEVLLTEVEALRTGRIEHRLLFSATHFEAFFRYAVQHVATSIDVPFDFIASTRVYNRIEDDYRDHIAAFVSLSNERFGSYESLTSFIASSILMDAYPPRMHGKYPSSPM